MTRTVSRYVVTASLAFVLSMSLVACSRGRTDPQIIGDVVTKINADTRLPNKQLAISSSSGVVTLSGTVASDDERAAAAGDAAQIEGVKTVVNNLAVTPPAVAETTPTPEPQQPEKLRPIARKKPSAVIQHSTSSYSSTNSSGPIAPSQTATNNTPVTPAAPPPPPPPPQPVTIPGGTTFVVRMVDGIDTARAQAGDTFRATLDAPITMEDKTVVPKGAEIVGRVAEAKGAGHFAGKPQLALELSSFSMNGREYSLHTNQYTQQGESRGTRTAETVGGGAALGAIIGAIAGGGRGAAIGATVGAAGGGGVQAATKAKQIVIAPEAQLSFRLESPLTVTPGTSSGHNRGDRVARDNRQSPTDYSDNTSDLDQPVLRRRPSGNNTNNDDNN